MDVIVIPTYNEADNIGDLLDQLPSVVPLGTTHLLVVDDSSPDGTGAIVRARPELGASIFLESRAVKDGLGNAYRHGFRWAHGRGYERVVQMDADGSHAPAAVRDLLLQLVDADIAVGSRYVPGGTTVGWPLHRRLVSRLGNAYVRALLRVPVRDATSGFRAYRSAALASLVTDGGEVNGYCFHIESTWRAASAAFTIRRGRVAQSRGRDTAAAGCAGRRPAARRHRPVGWGGAGPARRRGRVAHR